MTDEIRQDGKVVLSSEDGFSIPMLSLIHIYIMNPDPDTIFKENDTVWIVGKRKIIKGLNKD